MKSSIKLSRWIAFACFLAAGFTSDYANSQSGNQTAQQEAVANQVDDSLLPTGRTISPAGDLISFYGRPVDIKLSPDGIWLFAKDRDSLRVIDAKQWKLIQKISSPDGASLWGLAVAKDNRVYFTNSKSGVHVFSLSDDKQTTEQTTDHMGTIQRIPIKEHRKRKFQTGSCSRLAW